VSVGVQEEKPQVSTAAATKPKKTIADFASSAAGARRFSASNSRIAKFEPRKVKKYLQLSSVGAKKQRPGENSEP
jgi:hypothetical protein